MKKSFYDQLTTFSNNYKKLKTIKGIDRKFEFMQDENQHSLCSLLLSAHYGTPEDVETIKNLIVKQSETLAPNRAYNKRIKITSKFYAAHKKKLTESL